VRRVDNLTTFMFRLPINSGRCNLLYPLRASPGLYRDSFFLFKFGSILFLVSYRIQSLFSKFSHMLCVISSDVAMYRILWPRFKDSWPRIDVAVPVQAEKCSAFVVFSFHLPLFALAVVAVLAGMPIDNGD